MGRSRMSTLLGMIIFILILVACMPGVTEPPAEAPSPAYPALVPATAILPPYPWPTVTPQPTDPPDPTEEPTETIPPVPTPLPTPIVTSIPTAAPPVIPFPDGTTAQPFTLFWRDGEVIRSLRSEGEVEPVVFLDPVKEFSLNLTTEEIYLPSWGAISPDGKSLALILTENPNPDVSNGGPYPAHIYLLNLESRELRLLVKFGVEPAWSPDGKRLAYRSMETGGLWVMDVESGATGEIYAVSGSGHFATGFSWASDSRHLVMIDEALYESTGLFIIDADQQEVPMKLVGPPTEWAYNVQWSPLGEQISFTSAIAGPGGWQLQIANLDGTWNQLASDVFPVSGVPHWSPDGKWIAFGGSAIYETASNQTDLWLTDTVGKTLIRLTYDTMQEDIAQAEDSRPMWSPDGTQLAFRKGQEVWSISLLDGSKRKLFSVISTYDIGLVITQ